MIIGIDFGTCYSSAAIMNGLIPVTTFIKDSTGMGIPSLFMYSEEKDRELYLVCLILHLQRHFLTYGIGLKQVCDVAVMLHAASLDRERTAGLLRRLHAVAFSRLLFGFIDVYLGGTERYPLSPVTSGKRFDVLCDVIMNDGYHRKGQQEALASRSRWAAVRIARNVWFWARRSLRLFSILPGETCGFWWYMGWRRILSFSL